MVNRNASRFEYCSLRILEFGNDFVVADSNEILGGQFVNVFRYESRGTITKHHLHTT